MEIPTTRDALLQHAAPSKPSSPSAAGFRMPDLPDAGAGIRAAHEFGENLAAGGGSTSESFGGGEQEEAESGPGELHVFHHFPSGHAPADWNPQMADAFTPHQPPAPEPDSGSQTFDADSGLSDAGEGAL